MRHGVVRVMPRSSLRLSTRGAYMACTDLDKRCRCGPRVAPTREARQKAGTVTRQCKPDKGTLDRLNADDRNIGTSNHMRREDHGHCPRTRGKCESRRKIHRGRVRSRMEPFASADTRV